MNLLDRYFTTLTLAFLFLHCAIVISQSGRPATQMESNPNASIRGYLLTDPSHSLEILNVYRIQVNDGFLRADKVCSQIISKEASFNCPRLSIGSYLISVEEHGLTFYYPGVSSLSMATMIDLKSNENRYLELGIPTIQEGSVDGKILPAPKRAAFHLSAIDPVQPGLEIPLTAQPEWSKDQETWHFDDLPYGNYELHADWVDSSQDFHATTQFSLFSPNAEEVILSNFGDQSLDGQVMTDVRPASPLYIDLIPDDLENHLFRVPVDSNGKIHLSHVEAGEYLVTSGTNGLIVMSVSNYGRLEEAPNRVTIRNGEDTSLSIVVGTGTGTIAGQAVDSDREGIEAEVLLVDQFDGEQKVAPTDGMGYFKFEGLARHAYAIYAWPVQAKIPYRAPSIFELFNGKGIQIDLRDDLESHPVTVPVV